MDLQGALRARLLAAAPVAALVANRIYWVEAPQDAALPRITLFTVDDMRPQNLSGWDMRSARIQIDVWAASYSSSRAITEAIIAAVTPAGVSNGVRFMRTMIDSIRDTPERVDTTTIYRSSADILVSYATA